LETIFRDCLLTRTRQNAILDLNARIALKNEEELAGTDLAWQPNIPIAFVVLAIGQMG
jgi:hypothetical protein